MSTSITSVFGSEIIVGWQPRDLARNYAGFAGANGLTSMNLGTRGYAITITGRLRVSDNNYAAARAALNTLIETVEAYLEAAADDYTFKSDTYTDVVWDRLQLVPGPTGSFLRWNVEGEAFADFIMHGRSLT